MRIEDIIIPQYMTEPKKENIEKKKKSYLKKGKLAKIVIDEDNYLRDGLISYLVRKELGETDVPVVSYEKGLADENVYVFAHHYNNETEFVWAANRTLAEKCKKLNKEDKILVKTKYGIKPAFVTRVETSEIPPVNCMIRHVFKVDNVK